MDRSRFFTQVLFFFSFFQSLILQNVYSQNPEWINYTYNDDIRSIVGKDDILWIETGGGLIRFNTSTEEKEFFNFCNSDLKKYEIGPKFVDSLGNLWFTFGSSSRGIIYYNSIVKYLIKFDGNEMEYFPIDMNDWKERGFSTTKIVKNENKFYIGTWDKGLLMFDGINWTVFDTLTSDIPTNNILDIELDENSGLWIGSSKQEGLIHYNNTEWKVFDSSNSGCPNEIITDIEIDDHGKIWLTSLNKLVSFSEHTWQVFENPSSEIRNIVGRPFRLDSNNEPWLLRDRLYHFSENTWKSYQIEPEMHYYQKSAFYIDNHDNKWLSSNLKTLDGYMDYFKDGLSSFNNGVWNNYSLSNSKFKGKGVGEIFKDSKNNIWLDSEIITKINDNTWTYFSPKFYGYPIKAITSINEDSDGNMWFGTNFKGLLKFDGTNWEIFDTTNSYIPSERVYDMEFDKDGNLWFITEWNLGLVKFDGIDFTIYDTTNSGIPTNYLHQIESDSEGNLWFGTLGEGLVKYDFNKWTIYDTQIKWNEISSLYIDDEDCVWIGGAGLTTFKNGSWAYYEHDDSIDYYLNSITHLTEDSDNNIWATARYGLYKFDGNNWQKFDHTNASLPDEFLGDLEFDQYGNLWLGTSSGVILYKEGGVVTEINEAISTNMISKYELSQNYPNPFNPTTKIKYFIPSKAVMLNSFQHLNNSEIPKQVRDDEPLVILKIYDILGREVETLVNQQQKPGNYEVEWNAADQPSGIYFYQLSAGSYVDSRKMILLK